MLQAFLSVLPIFALVMTGFIAKRLLPQAELWQGIEKLFYYLFFPILLILEISKADFSKGGLLDALTAPFLATLIIAIIVFILKYLFKIENKLFTSVFQGSIRYSSYIFIALSHALFGEEGIVLSGVFMAYMIITVNVLSISVMNVYGDSKGHKKSLGSIVIALAKNPLIIGVLIGLLLNVLGIHITGVVRQYFAYLGDTALPLSLMSVGAGLIIMIDIKKMLSIMLTIFLKLLMMPLLTIFILSVLGATGTPANIALLFAALPSASSAYILSQQMGGDSEAMASIITWSTLLSILTIPMIVGILGY